MTLSDQIRDFAAKKYIIPARQAGQKTVTVNVGKIHSDLGLKNRVPAVCSALGSKIFERQCGITQISWDGPLQSTSVNITYSFDLKVSVVADNAAPKPAREAKVAGCTATNRPALIEEPSHPFPTENENILSPTSKPEKQPLIEEGIWREYPEKDIFRPQEKSHKTIWGKPVLSLSDIPKEAQILFEEITRCRYVTSLMLTKCKPSDSCDKYLIKLNEPTLKNLGRLYGDIRGPAKLPKCRQYFHLTIEKGKELIVYEQLRKRLNEIGGLYG